MECANDLNSMIDVGKVADLVLLMIDGSYGFEMVCLLQLPLILLSFTDVYIICVGNI